MGGVDEKLPEDSYQNQLMVVEPHGIEHIDSEGRHGKPSRLFNVWFASQMHLTPLVLGGLAITFGLNLWGAIVSIVVANVLGSLGTAAAVAMGPRLGMPQMPMSRSSFGYHGNYLVAVLAWLGYIGWFSVENILGAQTITQLSHLPYVIAALLLAVITIVIAVYGYNLVHGFERVMTYVSIVVFLILTVIALSRGVNWVLPAKAAGAAYWKAFFLEFTIIFSFTVTWAPYGADYSRYLPAGRSETESFWYSFFGLFLGTSWTMVLGAVLATFVAKATIISIIGKISGGFAVVAFLVIIIGAMTANVLNIYSGALSALTFDLPLKRWGSALIIGGISIVMSVFFGGPAFVAFLKNFLFTIVYWCTPWLGIQLVDYFLVHRSGTAYRDVLDFYRPHGPFGGVNWKGLLAFLTGLAVSVPFMASPWYTGPLAKAWGGSDFSYFVSFLVAAAVYAATAYPGSKTSNAGIHLST